MFIEEIKTDRDELPRCSARLKPATRVYRKRIGRDQQCDLLAHYMIQGSPYCHRHAGDLAVDLLFKLQNHDPRMLVYHREADGDTYAFPILYRHEDGTFTLSTPTPEGPSCRIEAKEAVEIMRRMQVPEATVVDILANRTGFVVT